MKPTAQSGLTLIELMVSILLATILTAGLFYMMSGQQQTYTSQLSNMTTQENLWGAMEYLQGQVRRAGYGFTSCNGELRGYDPALSSNVIYPAINIRNGFNLLTNSTDPGLSDSFQVIYSTKTETFMGVKLMQRMPSSVADLRTNSRSDIAVGDYLVVWRPGAELWCSLLRVTGTPVCTGSLCTIPHNQGGSGSNIFPA